MDDGGTKIRSRWSLVQSGVQALMMHASPRRSCSSVTFGGRGAVGFSDFFTVFELTTYLLFKPCFGSPEQI